MVNQYLDRIMGTINQVVWSQFHIREQLFKGELQTGELHKQTEQEPRASYKS